MRSPEERKFKTGITHSSICLCYSMDIVPPIKRQFLSLLQRIAQVFFCFGVGFCLFVCLFVRFFFGNDLCRTQLFTMSKSRKTDVTVISNVLCPRGI